MPTISTWIHNININIIININTNNFHLVFFSRSSQRIDIRELFFFPFLDMKSNHFLNVQFNHMNSQNETHQIKIIRLLDNFVQ